MSTSPLKMKAGSRTGHNTNTSLAEGSENSMNLPNLTANDDEAEKRKRRKSSGRRKSFGRKSLGGKGTAPFGKGGEEYFQQLAEMCSTVIELNSQNKINQKNAWDFNLIDSLSDVCVGGAEKAHAKQQQALQQTKKASDSDDIDTINFQRASCTLDASVKIYSYRVDDTHTSSFKVLENLSRNRQSKKDDSDGALDDEVSEDGDNNGEVRKRKRVTRGGGETLADVGAVTAKSVEQQCEADPLFHKMSLTFDEGGAKGMLLHNLCMFEGCDLAFDSELPVSFGDADENDDEECTEEDSNATPTTVKRAENLSSQAVQAMAEKVASVGGVKTQRLCPLLNNLYSQREKWAGSSDNDGDSNNNDDDDSDDDYDDGSLGMDLGVGMGEGAEEEEAALRRDERLEAALASGGGGGDDDGMVFDCLDDGGGFDAESDTGETTQQQQQQSTQQQGSEYSFAPALLQQMHSYTNNNSSGGDVVMVGDGSGADANTGMETAQSRPSSFSATGWARGGWAGAGHWKFPSAMRSKKTKSSATTADGAKTKTRRTAKSALIDFTGPKAEEKAFAPPPRSAASTQLSQLAITRNINGAAKLLLPVDLHYELPMLTKLFLKPSLRVRLAIPGGNGSDATEAGVVRTGMGAEIGMGADVEAAGDDFHPADFGCGDDNDDDDDNAGDMYGMDDDGGMGSDENTAGLYSGIGLVEAARTVSKIDIKYDRVSKKVDVKKLKASMWDSVQAKVKPETENKTEADAEAETAEGDANENAEEELQKTSFSSTISEVSSHVPANVTVPFYFICMLHLANEKGLNIQGHPDLSDFVIKDEPGHVQGC